jgi:SAM-dependent methyltransferase
MRWFPETPGQISSRTVGGILRDGMLVTGKKTTHEQRHFWNAYWASQPPTVTARTMSRILDRIKLEYLQSILPGSGRTVEVGSGSGRLSCFLAALGYQTCCVDYSMTALKAAQSNYAAVGRDASFVAGDAFSLPFREDTFDVVLSTGLLEHFEDPSPIVGEMVRVLRAGGIFYSDIVPRKFSLFRSLDWAGKVNRAVTGQRLAPLYERSFTSREIHDLLACHGLVGPRVFPAGVLPPYLPLLYRSRRLREAEVRLVERTEAFWKRFDGTRWAEWLGFYYFAWAIKP